jgi:SAM-dependent methyltransferase
LVAKAENELAKGEEEKSEAKQLFELSLEDNGRNRKKQLEKQKTLKEFKTAVLVVGCGHKAFGNVNIDLYTNDKTQCEVNWNPKQARNFVKSNAENILFKNETFNYVFCNHTLEHIYNPLKAIKEMAHVTKKKAYFILPSQFYESYCATHIYTWNPSTLKALLSKAFSKVETGYTNRLNSGLGLKVSVINLFYRLFRIHTEIWAICTK